MKFHHCWAATALIAVASGVSTLAHAAAVSGQGTWETTLQGRDLDGSLATPEAYYDTVLNITWLADANYAGIDFSTVMTWYEANAWAASLNPYGSGITGWRLPAWSPVDGVEGDLDYSYIGTEDWGYNVSAPGTLYAGSTASEMAHLYYNTLGNKGQCDPATSTVSNCVIQPGFGLSNTGPFTNIYFSTYWSATEFANDSYAWLFSMHGEQWFWDKTDPYFAWAVHSGDVGAATVPATVPVPPAVWLLGSGLTGLIGLSRKRRR